MPPQRPGFVHVRDFQGTWSVPMAGIAAVATINGRPRVTVSDIARRLLDEALAARAEQCAASGHGPVRDGLCGRCGRGGAHPGP